jgi:putative transferase (TIGR04331 family)
LSSSARRDFALKPYWDDFNSAGSKWWANYPIKTVHGHFSRILGNFGIVVVDHNGTGYLEALSSNQPTIVFWDPQLWELRSNVKDLFAELATVGIFHDSPESAAAHVNRVLDSVKEWWSSQATQKVRGRFCDVFARTGENWKEEWKLALQM